MKISIIGAGAMGGALAEGLMQSDAVSASDLTISDPSEAALNRFSDSGASITTDNNAAAKHADIVMVVVKPWLVETVLKGIKPSLDYQRQLIVIIAAGVSSESILSWLDKGDLVQPKLLLAIPNTAIAVKESMTFLVPVTTTKGETDIIHQLFEEVGNCLLTEERLLAAGTTLASCGIAYAMRYVRASVEGGVEIGFRASDALQIVLQTVKGAVSLLQTTGHHPETEIDKVTTPGGVTIKGLNEMENAGFTSAVIRGLKAGM